MIPLRKQNDSWYQETTKRNFNKWAAKSLEVFE